MVFLSASIMGYAFFGLDAISSQMTNPFGDDPNDLPLRNFVQQVAEDTDMAMQGRDGDAKLDEPPHSVPSPIPSPETAARRSTARPSWDRRTASGSPSSPEVFQSNRRSQRQDSRQRSPVRDSPLRDPAGWQSTNPNFPMMPRDGINSL
jgi:hypothetical protein